MPVLARKITPAKWKRSTELGEDEVGADAVTADLKTTANTLSFWRCESADPKHLETAVLALAASTERPDRLVFVFLDEQHVRTEGLATRDTQGDTPVVSLRGKHVDVERLDLTRLGKVAQMVANAARAETCHQVSKEQVIALVTRAVSEGLVGLEDLKEKMKLAVEQKLQGSR